jgi:N utilization substance protein B
MGRRNCRDCIFKLVYQSMFSEDFVAHEVLDTIAEGLELEEQKYVLDSYAAVQKDLEDIKGVISKATVGYDIKRIYKVDLAILIDAVYEINYLKEPVAVVINEAVELAKKYSNEKSPSFINGVLSKIVNNKE